jgi:hypothetical protein
MDADPGDTEKAALVDLAVTGPAPHPANAARLDPRSSASTRRAGIFRRPGILQATPSKSAICIASLKSSAPVQKSQQ